MKNEPVRTNPNATREQKAEWDRMVRELEQRTKKEEQNAKHNT